MLTQFHMYGSVCWILVVIGIRNRVCQVLDFLAQWNFWILAIIIYGYKLTYPLLISIGLPSGGSSPPSPEPPPPPLFLGADIPNCQLVPKEEISVLNIIQKKLNELITIW